MRRALLIGADPAGFVGEDAAQARLVGIPDDLARVDAALARHGFAHRTIITGGAATRDGILAALRKLTAEAAADDAVFVYYTGHGGLVFNPDHGAVDPPEPLVFQYIVPTDHSRAKFRGIFSAELTVLVADLTAVTPNVTVVLDCCHATGVLLGHDKRVYRTRAIPRPWAGDIADFVAWLRQQGYDLSLTAQRVEGNPHAVRLVACSAQETASEFEDPDGTRGGVMTSAFVAQLNAAVGVDPPPIWDALGKAIRATVVAEIPIQNPDVLGPAGRRLFTVDTTATRDIFAIFVDAGFTFLRGGSLHGIRVGDRFLVLPLNVAAPDRELALAELEAELVATTITRVKRTDFSDRPPVPAGARAVRIVRALRRHRVALVSNAPDLAAAIAASPRLALTTPDEQEPLLATVVVDEPAITILDADGTPVRVLAAGDSPEHTQVIVGVLEQLARVRELLDLRSGEGPLALDAPRVEWAIVRPEGLVQLPESGAQLRAGDQFGVTVAQPRSRSIFVSILGVLPDRSIVLLSASEPQGVNLAQGEKYVLGQDRAGIVVGVPIPWPDVVPAVPQPLEIVVVTTDFPVDLRPLTADLHDINELIARVGKPVVYLGDKPAPRECRLAVVRRSARVAP